jgi:DMSO reductase family type II enzyme heme b subunit
MRYAVLVLITLSFAACGSAPAPVPDVVAIASTSLPTDPGDAVWNDAPEHVAKLLLQDLVEPRLQQASTPDVRIRARATGDLLALRLEWPDPSVDDLPGAGRFNDACAVQVPRKPAAVPDPQMGQAGNGVAITFWRADWQATVNGRGDSIRDLYPNALIDHYPFEAPSLEKGSPAQQKLATQYAPAEGAGNRRGGTRTTAVEDLIAEGPGTLSPAPSTTSRGRGVRTPTGWSVVITRPLPAGLTPKSPSQIAFAVWEGSRQEAGARKMRTGWIPISIRGGR